MKTCNVVLPGLAACLLVPMNLQAATPSHQCAQLWDDVLRLSCYDTAFGKPRPPVEAASSQTSVAPAAIPVTPAAPVSVAPAVASAAVVAPAAAAVPSAVTPAPAAAVAAKVEPPAAAKSDKKGGDVVAKVTAVTQALDGRLRVTLDNGQVWQQTELDSANMVRSGDLPTPQLFQVKTGDQITVKSGVLGSRQMVAVDGRASRVTLVK